MTRSELKDIINECIEERFNNIDSITEDTNIELIEEATKDSEKILNEYANKIKSEISKLKEIKSVKISDYHGKSIDIKSRTEYNDLINNKVVQILKEIAKKFEKKYNTNFYWEIKVATEDGCLIVLGVD